MSAENGEPIKKNTTKAAVINRSKPLKAKSKTRVTVGYGQIIMAIFSTMPAARVA
jgi:hypothetical protein